MARHNHVKYIFVTGGVVSSLGKGIASASIGLLLKSRGLRVTIQKFDPYLNVDPGTMNPFQHGVYTSPMMERKRISTSGTTSVSSTLRQRGRTTPPPARFTTKSSRRNVVAITLAQPSR